MKFPANPKTNDRYLSPNGKTWRFNGKAWQSLGAPNGEVIENNFLIKKIADEIYGENPIFKEEETHSEFFLNKKPIFVDRATSRLIFLHCLPLIANRL